MRIKKILAIAILSTLSGCSSSIKHVGNLGPQKHEVYQITHDDFLSTTRMLIILDKKGNVLASTGGTVAGGGTVGLQTAGTLATTTALVYGANAIEHGLQHATATVKGIPPSIDANVNITTDILKKTKPQ
jgi:hypothetical protein